MNGDWDTFAGCLADDGFTRVGPFGDVKPTKAEYVAFLSDLMPTLPGYSMDVTRVTYAGSLAFAELSETVEVDGTPLAHARMPHLRAHRRRAHPPRRGLHADPRCRRLKPRGLRLLTFQTALLCRGQPASAALR